MRRLWVEGGDQQEDDYEPFTQHYDCELTAPWVRHGNYEHSQD
jgi:hypothetical protein